MYAQENHKSFAGFDIGGTGIRGAAVSSEGQLTTKVHRQAHPSRETSDKAAKRFRDFALRVYESALNENREISATGVGMPEPSDYEKGILKVTHKSTLVPLYGRSLREIFAPLPGELGLEEHYVFFTNDGDTLGMGAIASYPNEPRLLVVGLGTGLASSFARNNELLSKGDEVPELWNMPFREGILEDYVSRRAIIRNFEESNKETGYDVKEVAEKAREGNLAAKQAFYLFGETLGEGLAHAAEGFRPTRIVIGGEIGVGAYDQFSEVTQQVFIKEYGGDEVKFSPAENDYLPIIGAARYAQMQFIRRL